MPETIVNLAEGFRSVDDGNVASELVQSLLHKTEQALESRAEWEKSKAEWYKLAQSQPTRKTVPFPGAANVCVPITASACQQWSARAYASLFEQPYPERVRVLPNGSEDIEQADTLEKFLNWQLISQIEEYEEQWDLALTDLPIIGCAFMKTYWDVQRNRPTIEYVPAVDVIVPYNTKDIERARFVTHRMFEHSDDTQRLADRGFYFKPEDVDLRGGGSQQEDQSMLKVEAEKIEGTAPVDQEQQLDCVYQIHVDAKLPGFDGHAADRSEKPYTITIHKRSGHILRLTSREERISTTKHGKSTTETVEIKEWRYYGFLPNTQGFYDYGFGHHLEMLNRMSNAVFNVYLDAARIANQPPLFFNRALGMRGAKPNLYPGSAHEVNDASQVNVPRLQGPGPELMVALSAIEQMTQQISNNTDELRGQAPSGVRDPTVRGTLARIEQGVLPFAVINKRLMRGMRREYRAIILLDQLYMEEEVAFRVLGSGAVTTFKVMNKGDISGKMDVVVTADPSFASPQQRRQEVAQIMEVSLQHPLIVGNPQLGLPPNLSLMAKILRDYLQDFGRGELAQYIDEPPKPSLAPEVENQQLIEGRTVEISSADDDQAHNLEHDELAAEMEGLNFDPEIVENVRQHIADHEQAMLGKELIRQRFAEQQAAGAAGAQGGGVQPGSGPQPAVPGGPVQSDVTPGA